MNSDWKQVRVDEVCSLIVDCVNKTAPVVDGKTPYRMIRTTNIKSGRLDLSSCRHVNQSTFEKWTRRAVPSYGDVLLTREAPLGEIAMIRREERVFLGQRVMQYRANPEKVEPAFLYYCFLGPELQAQIHSHGGSGSTVDHIRVPDCSKFVLTIPLLKEQQRICSVLEPIDARLDLLRQTNETLEAMARAIFKSWFLDFDPVRAKADGREPEGMDAATAALFPSEFQDSELGPIPHGWRSGKLSEIVSINPSRALRKGQAAPYLDMSKVPTTGPSVTDIVTRPLGSGCKFVNGDTLLAKITPCLENGKTAFVDFLRPDEVGWGSTELIVLAPVDPVPSALGYLLARDPSFRSFAEQRMIGTSGRQRVPPDQLKRFGTVIAESTVYRAFDGVVTPIFNTITANAGRMKTLSTLRDTLLPRLISGKLRVPEAEAVLAEAL